MRGNNNSGMLAVVAVVIWKGKEMERKREGDCQPEGSVSGSRACTGDGADSSSSDDVDKGNREIERRSLSPK